MSLHDADIKSRLIRFLDRKATPRRFEGKPGALADEIAALVAALTRSAPRGADALAGWWPHFEFALSEICGRNYPDEKEIRDAARRATKEAPQQAVSAPEIDLRPVAITARKMQRNDPVGEEWLWGRNAVELALSGLIDRETMQRYRSSAFLARKSTYGEAEALAWEAQAKDRHEAAKSVWHGRKDPAERRDTSVPDKSAPYSPESFAAE